MARLRNTEIEFIFQFHYLLDEFTCLKTRLPVTIRKGAQPEDVERVAALCASAWGTAGNRPGALRGEQQRTAVVRALTINRAWYGRRADGNLDSVNVVRCSRCCAT